MIDAISTTTSNETSSKMTIPIAMMERYAKLPLIEAEAALNVDIAKLNYNRTIEGSNSQHTALNDWYGLWRVQVNIAESDESALLALETALVLTSRLQEVSGESAINDAALSYMKQFWEDQLNAHNTGQAGLIKMLEPIDSTTKAAILYRIHPPDSKESGGALAIWAELTRR